jgi:hypothetical protein
MLLLSQLIQYLLNILFCGKHEEQLKLRHFDVDWIVVFAKKDPNIVAQNLGPPLEDKQCVPKR